MREKILVIRLGALGDLVLCMEAFAALRRQHNDAEIALLTTPPFETFAKQMPWFDKVIIDPRPRFTQIKAWQKLVREVKDFAPTHVYDFQGKLRQSVLFNLLGGPLLGPKWSGAATGCSHPRFWPPQKNMHYTTFLVAQLACAGVEVNVTPELSWLDAPINHFKLPEKFALLIAGCAPARPYKRWPALRYAALAKKLAEKGVVCAAIGTKADEESVAEIRDLVPDVINFCGQTTLPRLGGLARKAEIVVGNDTGPTHLAAAVGAKTIALMSHKVDPYWSAPKGPRTKWLQGKPLAKLSVEDVWDAYSAL
ncbi:MAG TPA: ADP-heptose--LPS heptosyltransferase [Rhodospirillaceae bacterium]|nr:ADP-heptose--LPS heptosyltransferase [Rhodospirillaceae bacterium]